MFVGDTVSGTESAVTHFQLLRLILSDDEEYKPTIFALARIVAAKPHSMDVERLISSYNLIKSTDRSSLSGDYFCKIILFVRHNMPCTAKFDARQAVEVWMSRAQRKPRHDRDITRFMHQEYVATFFGTSSSNTDSLIPLVVKF